MADLLTDAERDEIRAGIQDVTDTFAKTPITISVLTDNADRMGRQAGISFTDYSVNALLEFGHLQSDQVFMNEDGSMIRADIKMLLNVEDIGTVGLLDVNNQLIINMATDKVTVHGVQYRIILAVLDGAIGTPTDKDKNLICLIYANREPTLS